MIIAGYGNEPYAHIIPADQLLSDIRNSLPGARSVEIRPHPPAPESTPPLTHPESASRKWTQRNSAMDLDNDAARGGPDDRLTDIHIDLQFAKIVPECNTPEYAKKYAREPWKHCRDAPNTFLSIRVNTRDEFMRQLKILDHAKHDRVQHEINRIKETRLRFEAYSDKRHIFDALRESQRVWRSEVVDNVDEYLEATYNKDPAVYEHRERDIALLRRLKSHWPLSGEDEPLNEESHQLKLKEPDPDHGFKACAMYFRPESDGTGWVGASAKHKSFIGKFPNQKIPVHQLLQEKEDNPLTKNEGDYLRYFHFPANNMSWIEVRAFNGRPSPRLTATRKLWQGSTTSTTSSTMIINSNQR